MTKKHTNVCSQYYMYILLYLTCWIAGLYNEAFDIAVKYTAIVIVTCTQRQEIL